MSSPVLQQELLDYIQVNGAFMEKAAAEHDALQKQKAACASLIPQAVQALLENDRIEPHQKEAAERILQDPVKVLEVLIKTAKHRSDAELARIGQPVDPSPKGQTKKAGANNMGRRAASDSDAATQAMKARLGLV